MNEAAPGTPSWGDIVWELPGGTPAACALAAAAAVICAALALRALKRRPGARRAPAWGAAAVRAVAVAAAVLAAAGPQRRSFDGRDGERVVAAHADAQLDERPDRMLRWPEPDAPDAATALEILRATREPGSPLELVLAAGRDATPSGAAVERALRSTPQVSASVLDGRAPPSATDLQPRPSPPHLVTPSGATEGVPVTLELQAQGAAFVAASAQLRMDDREGAFDVAGGARRVTTPPVELPAGTHLAQVQLLDRPPAVAFVEVGRAPRVTYVAVGAAAHPLVATLAAQGLPVTALEPSEAARDGFAQTDVILLGPGATGAALSARVAGRVEAGAGLLVLGGAGDKGLRRHAESPVEPLLPVTLPPAPPPPPPPDPPPPEPPKPDPPEPPPPSDDTPEVRLEDGPKEALRIALLLVIDRSGSMAGSKIRLAQMAAMAAARNLSPEDRVAVLAFDDRIKWIAPFQDASDLSTLSRRVGALRAEGGTDFFPALQEGFEEILRQRCGIRHVILLSDGATRAAVFRPTVEGAAEQAVTLSTVAIGDGADTRLLGLIAGWGKGRLYLATNPERLPEIVTVDARRFTLAERERRLDEMEETPEGLPDAPTDPDRPDEPTADATDEPPVDPTEPPEPAEPEVVPPRIPRVLANAALLEGLLDAEWPAFPHPEEPTARGVVRVVLGWADDVPALVLGRFGDAHVAVLAADVATTDAAALHAWPEGAAFLAQLVRSLAESPDPSRGGVIATLTRALDGSARVALPVDAAGILRLRPIDGGDEIAVACTPLGGAWTGARLSDTPDEGVFTGVFVPATEGVAPREVALVSTGRARQPAHALRDLATAGGAALIDGLPAVRPAEPGERREPASAPLLGAAALLLVAEAALRRVL